MNRIKELRKKKKLTQKELAKELGITQTVVGKYEHGDISPRPDKWQKMADFFGVSIDYLKGAWSKDQILKLIQNSYIGNLGYIDKLLKEQFEEEKEEGYVIPLRVLGNNKEDSNGEKLALAINDFFNALLSLLEDREYSFLIEENHLNGGYDALLSRDISNSDLVFHSESEQELIKQLDTLKASLKIALSGNNRKLVLNDAYIWQACFSRMLNDELLVNLMQTQAPQSTLEIALRLLIDSNTEKIEWKRDSRFQFSFNH